MQLILVAVGARMPGWVDAAFDDYAKRMPPELPLVLREVRPESRTAGKTAAAMMRAEGDRIRPLLAKRGPWIALDEQGTDLTSAALATRIEQWRAEGDDVSFIIGGPDGLAADIKSEARVRMRLSSMTLPHGMARVLLAEQLYRAWSITQNHPYHRA